MPPRFEFISLCRQRRCSVHGPGCRVGDTLWIHPWTLASGIHASRRSPTRHPDPCLSPEAALTPCPCSAKAPRPCRWVTRDEPSQRPQPATDADSMGRGGLWSSVRRQGEIASPGYALARRLDCRQPGKPRPREASIHSTAYRRPGTPAHAGQHATGQTHPNETTSQRRGANSVERPIRPYRTAPSAGLSRPGAPARPVP